MADVQLYDKDGDIIFPKTKDKLVTSDAITGRNTVNSALSYLDKETTDIWDKIAELTGDKETVTSIEMTAEYLLSKSTDRSSVIGPDSEWSGNYVIPTPEYPYTWKRTTFEVGEITNSFYEIIASFNLNEVQNIYITTDNTASVTITYPLKKDDNGEDIEGEFDYTAYDETLPEGWSETPQSISASLPYLYMSTRKRVNGVWGKFSSPALLGKWSFDSKIEMKYQITSGEIPTVDRTLSIPDGWGSAPENEFLGKLWMITSTSVNGQPVKDTDGYIWSNPILMAIVS